MTKKELAHAVDAVGYQYANRVTDDVARVLTTLRFSDAPATAEDADALVHAVWGAGFEAGCEALRPWLPGARALRHDS